MPDEELGFRKVVWTEDGNTSVIKGEVTLRDDGFVFIKTHKGELLVNKNDVISIKEVVPKGRHS